jgi:hypothetical protein
MSTPASTNTTVTPATTVSSASAASILPKPVTLLQAAKLAMDQDKPILLDYYRESATNGAFLGEDPESKDKILIKTKDDFTSIIKKLYRPEADGDYIIITENSIYVASSKLQRKRVNISALHAAYERDSE